MRTALNSKRLRHRSSLTAPTLVALTSLAVGAVLASAVNATFSLLAAFVAGVSVSVLIARCRHVMSSRQNVMSTAAGSQNTESPAPAVRAGEDCPSFIVLPAYARADELTRVLFAQQTYFPVAQGGEVVGVICKGRLLCALSHGQGDRLIAELMNHTASARPMLAS